MDLPDLPAPILKALMDVPISEDDHRGEHGFALLDVLYLTTGDVCPLWVEHRDALLRAWIQDRPGTRPSQWWHHDAPRQPPGLRPGWHIDGRIPEPRLRLGGTGTAAVDVFDVEPVYRYGIPAEWLCDDPEELAEKLAWCAKAGIHAVPIDPDDPPQYESQASFLRRFGLFMRGEEKRLPANAFEPEVVRARS